MDPRKSPLISHLRPLARIYAQGIFDNSTWLLALWLAGVLGLTALVRWDGAEAIFCGVSLKNPGPVVSREGALLIMLEEFFSWAWLVGCLAYVLPSLLLPLAGSFSISHVLWARLTPCSASDVALARISRLAVGTILIGALSCGWALTCAAYHEISPWSLLVQAAGVTAHLLWSGGLILILGPALRAPTGRTLAAFVALLVPVVSFLIFYAVEARLGSGFRTWWPFALPFAYSIPGHGRHFLASAGVGVMLLTGSVVLQRGKIVFTTPFSNPEIPS